jgi:hypothetical protein
MATPRRPVTADISVGDGVWIDTVLSGWRRVTVVYRLKPTQHRDEATYRLDIRREGAELPLYLIRVRSKIRTDAEHAAATGAG